MNMTLLWYQILFSNFKFEIFFLSVRGVFLLIYAVIYAKERIHHCVDRVLSLERQRIQFFI